MKNFKTIFSKPITWIMSGLVLGAVGMAVVVSHGGFSAVQAASQAEVLSQEAALKILNTPNILQTIDKLHMDLAKAVTPSVVNIRTGEKKAAKTGVREFSEGSGVIIRPDGWIVTNAHVVGRSKKIFVTLSDGREVEGTVRSTNDPQVDIAVVKIDRQNLPAAKWGDSSVVKVGQMAMAIGSPLGLENSVTFGHISATSRGTMIAGAPGGAGEVRVYSDMFQTDASINPGNSGGALCDAHGHVIAINTAIPGAIGYNIGIGFAMKSKFVKFVSNKLIETGKIVRSYIGVMPSDLLEYQKKELGEGGALVESVVKGGPADNAGVKKNDVIVRFGKVVVRDELDLRIALMEYAPGINVPVEILRNKKPITVEIKTQAVPEYYVQKPQPRQQWRWEGPNPFGQEWPPFFRHFFEFPGQGGEEHATPEEHEAVPAPQTEPGKQVKLGVVVSDVTSALQEKYHIPQGTKGAIVVDVIAGSIAEKIGMKPGEVIRQIGNVKINNKSELEDVVKKIHSGDVRMITFIRYGKGSRMQVTETVQF